MQNPLALLVLIFYWAAELQVNLRNNVFTFDPLNSISLLVENIRKSGSH
jgi:hypothetical protein